MGRKCGEEILLASLGRLAWGIFPEKPSNHIEQSGRIGGRLKQGKREKSRLEDWGDGKQFECLARVGRGG